MLSVEHVESDEELLKSLATRSDLLPQVAALVPPSLRLRRANSRQRVFDRQITVCCASIRIMLRNQPTTSGVLRFVAARMLDLPLKQDACIVNTRSVCALT